MNEEARLQLRREDCRKEVRDHLAERPGLSFPAHVIAERLRRSGHSLADVAAALVYLQSKGHVQCDPDGDGATLYWQITAEGTLAHERG